MQHNNTTIPKGEHVELPILPKSAELGSEGWYWKRVKVRKKKTVIHDGRSWKLQKILKKRPIPTMNQIENKIMGIEDHNVRALMALHYLTACRNSEPLDLRPKDIVEQIIHGRRFVVIQNIHNRKNENREWKTIPVPAEDKLAQFIIRYIKGIKSESFIFPSSYYGGLQPISKRWAHELCRKNLGMNPHWLRHLRLTHLVTDKNFSENHLIMMAGWTDGRPGKHYIEMRWQDLAEKM
jgi:integrase